MVSSQTMMTSSNGNIFHVTGPINQMLDPLKTTIPRPNRPAMGVFCEYICAKTDRIITALHCSIFSFLLCPPSVTFTSHVKWAPWDTSNYSPFYLEFSHVIQNPTVISFRPHQNYDTMIATEFCTYHRAVTECAKICSNLIPLNRIPTTWCCYWTELR